LLSTKKKGRSKHQSLPTWRESTGRRGLKNEIKGTQLHSTLAGAQRAEKKLGGRKSSREKTPPKKKSCPKKKASGGS